MFKSLLARTLCLTHWFSCFKKSTDNYIVTYQCCPSPPNAAIKAQGQRHCQSQIDCHWHCFGRPKHLELEFPCLSRVPYILFTWYIRTGTMAMGQIEISPTMCWWTFQEIELAGDVNQDCPLLIRSVTCEDQRLTCARCSCSHFMSVSAPSRNCPQNPPLWGWNKYTQVTDLQFVIHYQNGGSYYDVLLLD